MQFSKIKTIKLFIIIILGCLLFGRCNTRDVYTNVDLDKAIESAKKRDKKLLFIATINGCSPCNTIQKKIAENDTLKSALKDYLVVVYSGDITNLSLANKIIGQIKSPATIVFNKMHSVENVVFGFKNVNDYLYKIQNINISDFEKSRINMLLKVTVDIKRNNRLSQRQFEELRAVDPSFFNLFLLFKNSMLSKQYKRAQIYAKECVLKQNNFTNILYNKEILEIKNFKPINN
ncbi:hypothetical protein EZ456_01655 [Pedobacter psychrodurus]|uniref:Thioredoxin-like protein n=1 Tax=Pedobacter psychrodurus TaxID=2530456 RepID=A0A4R0QBQ8_9SPHI|nr:hypothetical protein [Pedobacter psychrodurus]TCD29751.1 hypothetical protein EZ456_01655 [Pedobacter psychrodurus]